MDERKRYEISSILLWSGIGAAMSRRLFRIFTGNFESEIALFFLLLLSAFVLVTVGLAFVISLATQIKRKYVGIAAICNLVSLGISLMQFLTRFLILYDDFFVQVFTAAQLILCILSAIFLMIDAVPTRKYYIGAPATGFVIAAMYMVMASLPNAVFPFIDLKYEMEYLLSDLQYITVPLYLLLLYAKRASSPPQKVQETASSPPRPLQVAPKPGPAEQLAKLFAVSKSVKITDVCKILHMSRGKLVQWIMESGTQLGVQIDGDFLVKNT